MARTVLSLLTISTFPGYRMGFQYIVLGGGSVLVWRVYPMRIGCMHLHTNLSWQMAYLKGWALTA
jgi:hypothetical protein